MAISNTAGRKLPRAKPVTLTFYDRLLDYPFRTTVYLRDHESDESIRSLIEIIHAVSLCVLGSYKIGYQEYLIPDYQQQLKSISPFVMGSHKWVVKYRTTSGSARSFAIPGRDESLSLNASRSPMGKQGKRPDPNNPKWQALVKVFKQTCVSKEGENLMHWVGLDYRNEVWPPKGAKRR